MVPLRHWTLCLAWAASARCFSLGLTNHVKRVSLHRTPQPDTNLGDAAWSWFSPSTWFGGQSPTLSSADQGSPKVFTAAVAPSEETSPAPPVQSFVAQAPQVETPAMSAPLLPAQSAQQPLTTPSKPSDAPSLDPSLRVVRVSQEVADLRGEIVQNNRDMWSAVKLISETVSSDEKMMEHLTRDVSTLRGRRGVVQTNSDCSGRQSSCSDCLASSACVWCEVEQRCYGGDDSGPLMGECQLFQHGHCNP